VSVVGLTAWARSPSSGKRRGKVATQPGGINPVSSLHQITAVAHFVRGRQDYETGHLWPAFGFEL
jgi:hypothetical protein